VRTTRGRGRLPLSAGQGSGRENRKRHHKMK
jgi:hypothetical protein